jgi:DNA-binding SARP family transcriptional activator
MTPRLRLLGRARVFDGEQWFEAPHDKRFGLLAYLACAGDWVEREKLAFLFWPDVEDARARRDLRNLIYRTRELSFASSLETQPGSLRWQPETDVRSFRQAVAQQDWEAAVALYERPPPVDSPHRSGPIRRHRSGRGASPDVRR